METTYSNLGQCLHKDLFSCSNNFYEIEDNFEKSIEDLRNKVKVYLEQLEELV